MAKREGNAVDLKAKLLERGAGAEEEEEVGGLKERIWEESKKLWKVAAPASFTRFSTFGVFLISQAFIGHVGPTELAAYSITFTVLLRFSNGILLGAASAVETLCGQAYGAKQYHMLGIYLQRSWIVLTGCTICLMPIYIFSGPILLALGQDEHIVKVARIIALYIIGVNFSFIPSFTCQMFLQAQSKNRMIAYVAAISVAMHLVLSWLLMVHFELGINGAMTSTLIAYWFPNICQLLFVTCGGCRDTWKGLSLLAFKDLWPVVKLSLSSGGMLCLELWYSTILVLLTGNLRNAEVALDALSICLNISGLEMMVSLGFYAAVSVRVSNELGRGNSKGAKFATVIAVANSLTLGIIFFIIFFFVRGKISYIFTTSEAVAKEIADLSPLLATSILLNSVQPVISGVSIGAGWQSYVAYVNLACYYVIGIPSGVILGYSLGLQVKGVWIGMLFGILVQTCVLIVMTVRTDWDDQVSQTRTRLKRFAVPDESDITENKNSEEESSSRFG